MHSRAGAKLPFSSINYGTDTTPEGRMVIKKTLLAEDAGLGNGETPFFIHIFKVRDGYSANPETPTTICSNWPAVYQPNACSPTYTFMDAPFNNSRTCAAMIPTTKWPTLGAVPAS
jgi:ribonucleoside-triphosphate reductase